MENKIKKKIKYKFKNHIDRIVRRNDFYETNNIFLASGMAGRRGQNMPPPPNCTPL